LANYLFFIDEKSGLVAISRGVTIVLLFKFISYLGFLYYIYYNIKADRPIPGEGVLGIIPTLMISSILPVLVPYPGFRNQY